MTKPVGAFCSYVNTPKKLENLNLKCVGHDECVSFVTATFLHSSFLCDRLLVFLIEMHA